MKSNQVTTKTSEATEAATKESRPFSLTKFFTRNGHKKPPASPQTKPQGPPKSVLREYFESAVVTVVMALFGMTFIVQAVKVPTGSMQNTIMIGDHLLVNKFIFAPGSSLPFLPQRDIRRGDIIVFKYPGNRYDPASDFNRPDNKPITTNYVKRVIGVPGDVIRLDGRKVIVNGQALREHEIEGEEIHQKAPLKVDEGQPPREEGESYDVYYSQEPAEDRYPVFKYEGKGGELKVPSDHYFVMGDNRNNSQDSRFWGFVPRDFVIGRAMFVYWSYDESAPSQGSFLVNFFKNTRWWRTGTMVK